MSSFTGWKFDDPHSAEQAASIVREAAANHLVTLVDHAVVTWPDGADHPDTRHQHEDTWRSTGWGALWGLVVGALFMVPVVGGVAGAAIGAISRATADAG